MSVKWLCLDFKQSSSTKTEFYIHILISVFSSERSQSIILRKIAPFAPPRKRFQRNLFWATVFNWIVTKWLKRKDFKLFIDKKN